MATERKEPGETERLLAEVESMLGDRPAPQRSVQPHGPAEQGGARS